MSNIEKIKAEIERRMEACKTKNGFPAGTICAIRIETYEGLLSFLDTLQEEKPIEKDMKLVFKKNPAIQVTAPKIKTIKTGNYGWYDVEDCTDGGYEKILAPFSMAFWDLVEK